MKGLPNKKVKMNSSSTIKVKPSQLCEFLSRVIAALPLDLEVGEMQDVIELPPEELHLILGAALLQVDGPTAFSFREMLKEVGRTTHDVLDVAEDVWNGVSLPSEQSREAEHRFLTVGRRTSALDLLEDLPEGYEFENPFLFLERLVSFEFRKHIQGVGKFWIQGDGWFIQSRNRVSTAPASRILYGRVGSLGTTIVEKGTLISLRKIAS